jgi:hypothetical protein
VKGNVVKQRMLKSYVIGIDLADLAAVVSLPMACLSSRPATLAILSLLAAVIGSRSVRIPGLRIQVTASDAFVLCALAAVGPVAAPVVAFISTLGATLGSNRRPASIRTAFNLGAVTLSAAAGAWAFQAITTALHPADGTFLGLLGATAAYFLSNTLLVAVAICIEKKLPFFNTWSRSGLWTGISCLTSLLLATGLLSILTTAGPVSLILGMAGSATLLASYQNHKRKVEAAAATS